MIPIGSRVTISNEAPSVYKKIYPSNKEYYILRYNHVNSNYLVLDENLLHIPSKWVFPVEHNLTKEDVL